MYKTKVKWQKSEVQNKLSENLSNKTHRTLGRRNNELR